MVLPGQSNKLCEFMSLLNQRINNENILLSQQRVLSVSSSFHSFRSIYSLGQVFAFLSTFSAFIFVFLSTSAK